MKRRCRFRKEMVPRAIQDLAMHRTEFAMFRIYLCHDTIQEALANAWLQGVIDADQALTRSELVKL